ncbi:AAA family ATPase [Helicobacter rodentium]|uniref:AAA family ATPase n=1 Tax=Helicobacter rodentium TaxID=59617 RepID=UPI00047B5BA6|nr:AAA family ATPase [Helicobacter rodentium]
MREQIIAYIETQREEDKNFSQGKLEQKLGIKKTYLSQYLNNPDFKYAAGVEEKFAIFLKENKEKEEVKAQIKGLNSLDFIETCDVKRIVSRIVLASMQGDRISVILGASGTGKTRIVKEYCKNHLEAILIEATPDMNAKDILKKLCEELNLGDFKSNHAGVVKVATALKQNGKYVIVDEAEHLKWRVLETLRRVMDFSKQPLILVGTHWLADSISSGRLGSKKEQELAQLRNRCLGRYELRGLQKEEYIEICKVSGIPTNCAWKLWELGGGNFRQSEGVIRLTLARVSLSGKESATLEDLEATKAMMYL